MVPTIQTQAELPAQFGLGGKLRRALFGIAPEEALFVRRRFKPTAADKQARLEHIGRTFVHGYRTGLALPAPEAALTEALDAVDLPWRGFAYEGAAMALALLDALTPGARLASFLDGAAGRHRYMVFVGAGWAYARLGKRVPGRLAKLDPLLAWLAVDGHGFHEGYFRWETTIDLQARSRRLTGYAARAFDQGLGRSLMFVLGADVERIVSTLATFDGGRQPDLWAGVGLAAAYAGGLSSAELEALVAASGQQRPALAQGAAFASAARTRAGNMTAWTEEAARCLCGTSAQAAAALAEESASDLPSDGEVPAYEVWRQRLQGFFAEHRS
jgi:hypothetical protein